MSIFVCDFCGAKLDHAHPEDDCETRGGICAFIHDAGWRIEDARIAQPNGRVRLHAWRCAACVEARDATKH